jgi:hypothetical protein
MLGRILKKPSAYSSTFPSAAQPHTPTTPPPMSRNHKYDITFNERFLRAAPQPTVMDSLWRMKVRTNIRKMTHKRLPIEEKRRLYLESRPMKQKLLNWVGSRSRALVRAMGTVDAWTGPPVKNVGRLGASDIRLLGSGQTAMRMQVSDRAKRIMVLGMIVSMGGLMGWAIFGLNQTRAEGEVVSSEPLKKRNVVAVEEEKEKRPGVFVWGSNRFVLLEMTYK